MSTSGVVSLQRRSEPSGGAAGALLLALLVVCLLPAVPRPAWSAPVGGRLVVVHPGAEPPYFFQDAAGRPAGLLADFWRLVAAKAGLKLELRIAPDALRQVAEGRADVEAGLVRPAAAPPADGREKLLFTRPFLDLGIGLFAERAGAGRPAPASILEGGIGTVGIAAGDPSAAFLRTAFPGLRQRVYADLPSLAAGLALGQVQAAAGPVLQLRHYFDRLGGRERFALVRRYPGPQLCAAVHGGGGALVARLDAALGRVSLSDVADLEKRWGGAGPRPGLLFWGPVSAGAAVLAFGLAFGIFLRASRLRAGATAGMREVALLRENFMAEMARHKKTQELLAAAVEQSPSAVVIVFPGGETPLLNRQAMGLLGLEKTPSMDFFRHVCGFTLFTPSGRRVMPGEGPLGRVLDRGEPLHDVEYRLVDVHGAERWILVNAAPVFGRDGTRRAAVSVCRDITADRRSNRDLARFKFLLDAGVEEVYLVRPDGNLDYINEAAASSLGYRREELLGRQMGAFDSSFAPGALGDLLQSVRSGPRTFETGQRTRDGRRLLKEMKAFYMRYGDEQFVCVFGQDITESKRMQAELDRTRALFAAALEQTRTGILIGDAATHEVMNVNPAAAEMLGLTPDLHLNVDRLPEDWRMFKPDGSPCVGTDCPLTRALSSGECTETMEVRLERPESRPHWLLLSASPIRGASGALTAGIMSLTDITERKEMERRLLFKTQHDALTGLPNRSLCLERIEAALARAAAGRTSILVAFLDLDHFKILNDTLGHAFGDRVLAAAAQRLVRVLEGLGSVYRSGGDEFVLLIESAAGDGEDVQAPVRTALSALRRPMQVEGRVLRLTASVGVVLAPTADSPTAESILQNADLALHRAKAAGRDSLRLFHPGLLRRAVDLLALDADMRLGLERDEFVVFYQPMMRTDGGGMVGMEALVRWRSPTRGLVAPTAFIPHAEESGLIMELGERVLGRACTTMAAWRRRFPDAAGLSLAVNLSARQFAQPDIVERVQRILDRTGLPPERLKLELTESALMADPESALSAMRRFKDMGLSLVIDDFGTGYSSLAYLRRFPVDVLKIDRAFIRDLPSGDADSAAFVRAILALAASLHLHVVAEGVENREQLDILAKFGCETVQGFFFHAPLPEDGLEALLAAGEAAPLPVSPQASETAGMPS